MAVLQSPPASLTIRDLDGRVTERLRLRAARNGRSMEAEVRSILSETFLSETVLRETSGFETGDGPTLVEAIRRRVAPLGGVDLDEHPAVTLGQPPSLDP